MESFDLFDVGVGGHVPRERHCQVVAEGVFRFGLVGEVVDEFAILAVLPRQDVLQLESGGVDLHCSVFAEHSADGVDDLPPHCHLLWVEVPGALGGLDLALVFVFGLFLMLGLLEGPILEENGSGELIFPKS